MSNDRMAELWESAIEEHITSLSDNDFQAMVERTRSPHIGAPMSYREVRESTARKCNEFAARNQASARAQDTSADEHTHGRRTPGRQGRSTSLN